MNSHSVLTLIASDHPPLAAAIAALQPDGVILTPPHSDNPLITRLLTQRQIPFARIGSRSEGEGIALTMDDEGAAQQATRHLLALGHRSIGFIAGPADYQLSSWRFAGWRTAMDEAGISTEGLLATGDFSYASGELAARALLTRPDRPSAVIVSNDQMALATIEVAHAINLNIPEELSLVCFDNTPLVRFTRPPLTAVDQPVAEITARAVELLISAQRGEPEKPVPVVVPASLVVRESTAAPKHGG